MKSGIDDIDINPEIREKIRELKEEQEQEIQKKIDLGEIVDFSKKINSNGSSERHQNNNLNVMIEFSNYFDSNTTFYDINKKEQILSFLDTKIKDLEKDPVKRWITS